MWVNSRSAKSDDAMLKAPLRHALTSRPGGPLGYAKPDTSTFVSSTTSMAPTAHPELVRRSGALAVLLAGCVALRPRDAVLGAGASGGNRPALRHSSAVGWRAMALARSISAMP